MVTPEDNRRTKRNRRWIEWGGTRRLLIDVCREEGICHKAVEARIRLGWGIGEAITARNAGQHRSRDPILNALQACALKRGKSWSVIAKANKARLDRVRGFSRKASPAEPDWTRRSVSEEGALP